MHCFHPSHMTADMFCVPHESCELDSRCTLWKPETCGATVVLDGRGGKVRKELGGIKVKFIFLIISAYYKDNKHSLKC